MKKRENVTDAQKGMVIYMKELTERERAVLDYIVSMLRKNGYSPSIRDIKSALDFKSTSTVHTYLARLENKGYIQKEDGKSRTLRVEDAISTKSPLRVPLIGKVTAGLPILAQENFDGYVDFCDTKDKYNADNLFALRVSGTSMIDAGILDGDIVIVDKCDYADNGQIVVALVGDEATVKTFYRENGHFRLQPENKTMEPIIVPEANVLGRIVANIRFY